MQSVTAMCRPEAGTQQRGELRCPRLSVIIPTLNEAGTICATLQSISREENLEIIVVDGGSRDSTASYAASLGARVIHASPSRANQMNLGAAAATGEILLFLHADTRLPAGFPELVDKTLRKPGVVIGAFRLGIDSPRWSMRLVEALANFRSRWLLRPYGDQALFLRRLHFRMAVGFSKLPIMEDFEFVRRLGRWGRVALAPAAVTTSARRWKRLGVLRTTLLNQFIILAYLCGVSPRRLARWYRDETVASTDEPPVPAHRPAQGVLPETLPSAHKH